MLFFCLILHITAAAGAPGPQRHFELEAGDASVRLNEFSQQSDLQVLFDYSAVKGLRTQAVSGDFDTATALQLMLKDTGLVFYFVNDRTLDVTPRKPSLIARLWHRLERPPHAPMAPADDDELEQVLISGYAESNTHSLLGAQTLQLGRTDIDRSGLSTTQDFLRTLPQVFGGGPTPDTILGREATTNSARGSGVNLRGLDAGATLVLIDGKRIAPGGTAAAFEDISNIPLSIVDHIDILPDGASAQYGADAVGGVVNIITRRPFSGVQTQARGGGVTDGSMGERQISQLFGNLRESGHELFTFEYFERDALLASDRAQYTSDLTPFGGSNFDVPYGGPGTIAAGAQFWPIPKGLTAATLPATVFTPGAPNLYDQQQGTYITPAENRWSLFGKEQQKLSDELSLSLEGLFTRRNVKNISVAALPMFVSVPQSNPFYVNPTGVPGPLNIIAGTTPYIGTPTARIRVDTGNFSVGLSSTALHGWTVSGYAGYTFEKQHEVQTGLLNQIALAQALADPDPATAFNPFVDAANNNPATLAAIGGRLFFDTTSTLKTLNFRAVGPLLSLRGGDLEANVGAEYRVQDFQTTTVSPGPFTVGTGDLSRNVRAAFGELRVPIVGERERIDWLRRLELSVGARHETYSDLGGVTVPKVGLYWSLSRDWNIRSTWTRSFTPPALTDLAASTSYSNIATISDPASPTKESTILALSGTNPQLTPETARSWTVGTDFVPPAIPRMSVSLTYFDIHYAGRIDNALFGQNVLSLPQFAWLVTRNASAAEVAAACAQTVFFGVGSCSAAAAGITTILDNRLRNIALLQTRGIDLIGKYSFDSPVGRFDLGLNGTYLLTYSQANTPDSAPLNIVSTQNNPINLRARGSASWVRRNVAVSGFLNFENRYRDTLSVPNRGVAPWTTIDMQLSYETGGEELGWLSHTQFVLNVQNLFDVDPPFLNSPQGVGYDRENADLLGRMVSFEVRKRW